MKKSVLKQIYYLKENNKETETLKKMCDLIEFVGEKFILKKDALLLLQHFNEAQITPLNILKVNQDFISSLISSRTSLFSAQISYDKEYLKFLLRLIDIHCYEIQYRHLSKEKYLNERINNLKCAFFAISLDYKKNSKAYHIHEDIDFQFDQILERVVGILLYKTYFPDFWKDEYPRLKEYNPIMTKILENNRDYFDEYNQRRKDYYFANYQYKDVGFELEQQILLMVWTSMLNEYPSFINKEYILTLVMMHVNSNLSMLYEMISSGQFDDIESYINEAIEYCKKHSLRLYLH